MATVKEKLAQLGRPLRNITITVAGESVEVTYQRPTLLKDRLLRESMQEEYARAMRTFDDVDEKGNSVRSTYAKTFRELGIDKTVDSIISADLETYRNEAIKSIGKEQPKDDADQEVKDAWLEEFKPAIDAVLDAAREEFKKEDFDILVQKATDAQLDRIGRERAIAIYRLRLIMDSIYDTTDGGKVQVFDSIEDVEENLTADTVTELGRMIYEEVAKAREVPLTSVAKTS